MHFLSKIFCFSILESVVNSHWCERASDVVMNSHWCERGIRCCCEFALVWTGHQMLLWIRTGVNGASDVFCSAAQGYGEHAQADSCDIQCLDSGYFPSGFDWFWICFSCLVIGPYSLQWRRSLTRIRLCRAWDDSENGSWWNTSTSLWFWPPRPALLCWRLSSLVSSPRLWRDITGGSSGSPCPQDCFKSCNFQAILREKPLFWANFGLRPPPWG